MMGGGLFLGNMLLTAPGRDRDQEIVIARARDSTMAKVSTTRASSHDRCSRRL